MINECGKEKRLLIKASEEYNQKVSILLEEREKLNKSMKSDGYIIQRIKTYYNEQIIAFLSRKGIFPRYGFPVDTVELSMPINSDNRNAFGLQLQRDLSMAISEYAPGSQIVANGKLITSRYIKRGSDMLWKMYDYKRCCECGSVLIKPHTNAIEQDWEECQTCGEPLSGIKRTFIIPELGFIADLKGISKPGLVKPKRTYNNEVTYLGSGRGEFEEMKIGNALIQISHNKREEMLVVNESNFFVCRKCGYTEIVKEEKDKKLVKEHMKKHKMMTGEECTGNKYDGELKQYSLGYKFETNVTQIRFNEPTLSVTDYEVAYSVLQGILNGFRRYYNIDEADLSGCLHYYKNKITGYGSYEIILYDKLPGGSGYANMLKTDRDMEAVLRTARDIMLSCSCGGEEGNSSCYSCLRNYYNQKNHDLLKRKHVIDFVNRIIGEKMH